MSINATDLYVDSLATDAKAEILLICFDEATDTGTVGRIVTGQFLRSLHNERVATFDVDTLMDYRSHRSVATVNSWMSFLGMVMPETVLDLVEDDMDSPALILHGAKPDVRWGPFTNVINELYERVGVEITFSLHGVSSGMPYVRLTPVHVQATDVSLSPPGSDAISNRMQSPSPLSTFMQVCMGQRGIGGLTLLGAVLYYTADTSYPAASSALLTSSAKFADLSLPVGDLEQGTAQDQENIIKLMEGNPDISYTVSNLEEHSDVWTRGGGAIPLPGLGQHLSAGGEGKTPRDTGDVIETYLAQVSCAQDEEVGSVQRAPRTEESEEPSEPDTIEDVLVRTEARRNRKGPGPSIPHHRV